MQNLADNIAQLSPVSKESILQLIDSCKELPKADPRKGLLIARDAFNQSEEISFEEGKVRSLIIMGESLYVLSQFDLSLNKFYEALPLSLNLKSKKYEADIYHWIGNVNQSLSNYQTSLEFYFKSLNLKKDLPDKLSEGLTLNNIGIDYKLLNNYPKALEYYLRSLSIKEEFGDRKTVANTLNNIGMMYSTLGEYKKSNEYLFKSLKFIDRSVTFTDEANVLNNIGMNYKSLKNYGRALDYFNEAMNLVKMTHDISNETFILNNIGTILSLLNKEEAAIDKFSECLEITRKIGNKKGEASALLNLGVSYLNLKHYDRAKKHLNDALNIAHNIGSKDIEMECYSNLAEAYSKTEDYKTALDNYSKFHDLERSVYNEQSHLKSKGLIAQYESEKNRKEYESTREKNLELEKVIKNLDSLNEEKDHYIGIISHDLRDPVSAIYGITDLILTDHETMDKEELLEYIASINQSSTKILKILKHLLRVSEIESGKFEINIEEFEVRPLMESILADYKSRADKKSIVLNLHISKDFIISGDKSSIMSIYTNLISNAIKYSPRGKNIFVNITQKDSHVLTEIKDEGPGLTMKDKEKIFGKFAKLSARPTAGEDSIGLGLSIVKKLAEMNNGRVWVESELGNGASFFVELPGE